MRKDCGDAAETVRKDYGSSADIVRTKCGTTAFPLRTQRRSALLGHHTERLPRTGLCKNWTLDSGLDSRTGLRTEFWTELLDVMLVSQAIPFVVARETS